MSKRFKSLSPREATGVARQLGWTVSSKRRTGELRFVDPDGRRYVTQAPGRSSQVPLVLAKALAEARHPSARAKRRATTEERGKK